MASRAKTLRNVILDAIEAARSSLVVDNFEMTTSSGSHYGEASNFHLPDVRVEDLNSAGRVWAVALVGDQNPPMNRNHACMESIPIQICYQCVVDNLLDADFIDDRIELCEQLKNIVRKSAPNWCTWTKTEALKDDNGTPHSYVVLRESQVFMCVFTAYFETYLDEDE